MLRNTRSLVKIAAVGLLAVALPGLRAAASDDHLTLADLQTGLTGLNGAYSFILTGSVFLPVPFDSANGPFYRIGRFVADGNGNLVATFVANYGGAVSRGTFNGTYKVAGDGTFTVAIPNLPIPALPAGLPNVFTFDGVLAEGGKTAKFVLSGANVGGQALPNVGSVISGNIIKQ